MTVAPARHFIGGEFRDSLSGQTFDVISPVTEQVVTTAARGEDGGEHDRAGGEPVRTAGGAGTTVERGRGRSRRFAGRC